MTTVTAAAGSVTGGVDTHLDLHVAAAVDHLGGVLGTATFPTNRTGYRKLLAWLRSHGPLHQVGVEGTGSYDSALSRHLAVEGIQVVEVGRPNRQVRRRHGKNDVVDAMAAARAVLSGEATAIPKSHDGAVEALRALKVVQRSANNARQSMNQLRNLLVTAPELHGAGLDTASTLLITAGDNPHRLTHEKSFASLTGSSPLDTSSGKRERHRLNRGGEPAGQLRALAHRDGPARHRPANWRLRRPPHERRQDQDRSLPLP